MSSIQKFLKVRLTAAVNKDPPPQPSVSEARRRSTENCVRRRDAFVHFSGNNNKNNSKTNPTPPQAFAPCSAVLLE